MIDYFVVVFRKELQMLRLLIRSLVKFTQPSTCRSLNIAINEPHGEYQVTRLEIERIIAAEVKDESFRIMIVDFDPLLNKTTYAFKGWRSQQAFKLLSHRFCTTDNIVVLDSKNFAIRQVSLADFVSKDDKPLVHLLTYKTDNKFHELAGYSRAFFGIYHDPTVDFKGFPSITPAVLRRDALNGLEKQIEKKTGLSLIDAFMTHEALEHTTEFLLYNAYIESQDGVMAYYNEREPITQTFFGTSPKDDVGVANVYKLLYRDSGVKFSGMHRRRLARLDGEELSKFKELLRWSKLIESDQSFISFIESSREDIG